MAQGARALIDPAGFAREARGSAYLAPQCLVGVTHGMRVMHEESFAPIVGIMPVPGDDEAVALMNDSRFGLTASVWTRDEDAAAAIGHRIATGTWFMNRCDYLDPALAWVGIGDSGRGCALSEEAYVAPYPAEELPSAQAAPDVAQPTWAATTIAAPAHTAATRMKVKPKS